MQAINSRLTVALEHLPIPGWPGETVAAFMIYENVPGALRIVGAISAEVTNKASAAMDQPRGLPPLWQPSPVHKELRI